MNKIPVGQTIRFAYAFTLGEIGTIIGLIWVPTLINAVATFFVLRKYYDTLINSFESGMPPTGAGLGWPLLLAFLAMLLMAMIGVAIRAGDGAAPGSRICARLSRERRMARVRRFLRSVHIAGAFHLGLRPWHRCCPSTPCTARS